MQGPCVRQHLELRRDARPGKVRRLLGKETQRSSLVQRDESSRFVRHERKEPVLAHKPEDPLAADAVAGSKRVKVDAKRPVVLPVERKQLRKATEQLRQRGRLPLSLHG